MSNPSSNQEIAQAAAELARVRALGSYHVPVAAGLGTVERLGRLGRLGQAAAREARRRQTPAGVAGSLISRTATASDLTRVLAARLGLPATVQARIAEAHRRRFDRSVARRIDDGADAVVAVQGSAYETLRRARRAGARAILHTTLPHPRSVHDLIAAEEQNHPELAAVMGGDRMPRWMLDQRAAELAQADLLLTHSTFARRTYAEYGIDPARIRVLPLGVDTNLFSPAGPESRADRFRVLFVGRISLAKGVAYLVEAFNQIGDGKIELVLVGDLAGSSGEWLNQRSVSHLQPMPRAELPPIYRGADVLVMPSLAESFGFVALEAMACGTPVIASANSIGPDAITDGVEGLIVEPGDSEAIARSIEAIRSGGRELRATMARAARTRAEAFSWDAYRRGFLRIVAGDPGSGQ